VGLDQRAELGRAQPAGLWGGTVGAPAAKAAVGLDQRRMKRLQQAVSRKRKGSANRKNAVARLNRCHGRIAAMRRDFLQQVTTKLVADHALIAMGAQSRGGRVAVDSLRSPCPGDAIRGALQRADSSIRHAGIDARRRTASAARFISRAEPGALTQALLFSDGIGPTLFRRARPRRKSSRAWRCAGGCTQHRRAESAH